MATKVPIAQPDFSSTLDADELFVRNSISELRDMEKNIRIDIENKKQELRLMVGERYRDLIDAADSIVNMRHSALSIQEELYKMQDSCNVYSLKQTVSAQIDEDKKGTKAISNHNIDDRKYHLYSSAAQIKLLVDVPEQIWRSLENHKYLNASRLYLIAKLVYKNLQLHNDDAPFSVSITFPVVQRQWDAVSHFKTQILQKSTQYLKVVEQSEQSLAETLSAIMLLDDVTMKDVFRIFLEMRKSSLLQILNKSEKDSLSLLERLRDMIRIVRATIFQIGLVFMRTGNEKSLFESYLHQLQQGFTIQEDNIQSAVTVMSPRESKSSLTRLYSPSTNIHLLIRYLPESIQTFTPFLHTTGTRGQFPQEDIRMHTNHWVDLVVEEFRGKLGSLLANFTSVTDLYELRKAVWEMLKEDELSNIGGLISQEPKGERIHRTSLGFILTLQKTNWSWCFVCNIVLNKTFSIWNDVLREGFNQRFEDIILSSLALLSSQPENISKNYLPRIQITTNEERHLGKFIWEQSNIILSDTSKLIGDGSTLKTRIQSLVYSQTSCVHDAKESFDKILKDMLLDLQSTFSLTGFTTKDGNDDLFNAISDTEKLFVFFQDALIRSVESYRDKLNDLLNENIEILGKDQKVDEEEAINCLSRRLLIGRIAQAIACDSVYLASAFNARAINGEDKHFRRSSGPDSRILSLSRMLLEVYTNAHYLWIGWVVRKAQKTIQIFLNSSPWKEANMQTLVWEVVQDKSNGEVEESEKLRLPSQPSSILMNCLFNVCQEINRIGSPTLNKTIIRNLLKSLSKAIFALYESFINNPEQFKNVSEKGAIQMLYDVKFLNKVFEGCWSFHLNINHGNQNLFIWDDATNPRGLPEIVEKISNDIKLKIDPIDLAVFEPYINKNVERHYTRSAILLGLLLQLNPKISDTRRKGLGIQDYHNVLPVVPQAARFTLLPLSQGCGTMGVAILSGILDSIGDTATVETSLSSDTTNQTAFFAPRKFFACVSHEESAQRLARVFTDEKVTILTRKNVTGVKESQVILLCSKPQVAKTILTEEGMFEALENKVLISILAGVQIDQIKQWVPASTKIIRAMPNTCCR
ncbi:3524_t:CDS:10, partial [Ambispora leptoticha]